MKKVINFIVSILTVNFGVAGKNTTHCNEEPGNKHYRGIPEHKKRIERAENHWKLTHKD